jgi:hypothetical protein
MLKCRGKYSNHPWVTQRVTSNILVFILDTKKDMTFLQAASYYTFWFVCLFFHPDLRHLRYHVSIFLCG